MTIDERISAELRRHVPEVEQRVAWDRIRAKAPSQARRRTLMLVPATVVAGLLLVLGIVLVSTFDSEPDPVAPSVPNPGPTTSFLWPQANLEEVRVAQERADALDTDYLWQTSTRGYQLGQNHPFHESFFARFLEEVLGWEEFRWHEAFAHRDGLVAGDVLYVRCAPGEINPLYPDDREGECAPTIDEFRYETVRIHVTQLDSQGREVAEPTETGIFVVTAWEIVEPSVQTAPPTEAEITAYLEPFLRARIAGSGAEDFVVLTEHDPHADYRTDQPLPLLYATTTGAPYERWEYKVVDGPVWPEGRMQLGVELFADSGETVVEQIFKLERDETGRWQLVFEFKPTTENGEVVPVEYAFLDREVTYRLAHPLEPSDDGSSETDRLAVVGLLPDDGAPRQILLMLADPRPMGCVEAPATTDAERLAARMRSNPEFETTAPVAVTIGGLPALQMDLFVPGRASSCSWSAAFRVGFTGNRGRLYLLDLPGGSARVLAIAMFADEDSFETVLQWAQPIVDSIEIHTR